MRRALFLFEGVMKAKHFANDLLLSPGLKDASVLDLMCSHFVLTLAARLGPKFNVRRDLNSLLSLSGRHLVWPLPALQRL